MSETWFISDLHLGHQKIIEYTSRPFTSTQEMDETIIKNWNEKINSKDEVYILGDFSLTGREKTLEYLDALKGRKYLLRGNHDHWTSNPKAISKIDWVKDYFEIKENGNLWILCHYPIYSWNKRSYGSIMLHGHTHRNINLEYAEDGTSDMCARYLCVSVECINYAPISMTEIKQKFKILKEK